MPRRGMHSRPKLPEKAKYGLRTSDYLLAGAYSKESKRQQPQLKRWLFKYALNQASET